ncbi:hypothetical protein GUITHDRAFT_105656 [Guillardia theta CCMP2712]|uniref:RING-type E3 ubiquitin transferase n=1 Tax=Guillardia theta (strain CCMP2712) TaxID=905079 RepID=L1JK98_GUITC|nr:hypothetical protein GUITHDRAFT_105656 [Guillardia theta CCMP2712]EKX48510.1 hypothetical protein GUITHDRAFT_105656 [Guillardia theta CCMP2712]|eukprot:XP_005835490.1 hypothetical protein GUITHDRAFT_105656 [Guillardia theta CCMP2712]
MFILPFLSHDDIQRDNRAVAADDEDEEGREGAGAAGEDGDAEGKLYKGASNYQKFIVKRDVLDRKATAVGPMKAPSNVRLTCRFDYQPDLCKDYKETGYCTFGDSCKFMHDRGDYKSGWELERDWKAEQEKKKLDAALAELEGDKPKEEEEENDGLPFACAICRGPFNNPIETRCMHYFCESCALANYKKSKRCFVCNEQTQGQFNTATKIISKLNRLEEKRQKRLAKDEYEKEMINQQLQQAKFKVEQGWTIPGDTFQTGKEI